MFLYIKEKIFSSFGVVKTVNFKSVCVKIHFISVVRLIYRK